MAKVTEEGITDKQKLFADEYLIDLNGTKAAIRAGYSEHSAEVQASVLLRNPKVISYLKKRQKKLEQRTNIKQEHVIKELAAIAFSDLRNVMYWGKGGVALKESLELKEMHAAAISEVSQSCNQYGKSFKVKMYDKVSALDKLGKHLGMFSDKMEITGKDGEDIKIQQSIEDLSDEQLFRLVTAFRKSQPEPDKDS